MEITQFTYFQQVGSFDLQLVPAEITYGLDRIAMIIQKKNSVFDLEWAPGISWADVYKKSEYQYCVYNFEEANVKMYRDLFEEFRKEAIRLLEKGLIYPAYNYVIKCSHIFNLLDARGAVSVMERKEYISKVRKLSKQVAETLKSEEEKKKS